MCIYTNGPRCPYCGSTDVYSSGNEHCCGKCGQRWHSRFIRWIVARWL